MKGKNSKTFVESLYIITDVYGGPEEGGWYYQELKYFGDYSNITELMSSEEIEEFEKEGTIQFDSLRRIELLREEYSKKLDGTNNYEPYS